MLTTVLGYWYLWVILALSIFLVKWYSELQRFKRQHIQWVMDRQKEIAKTEPKINPSLNFKWLRKLENSNATKGKKIGQILSFKAIPSKGGNPEYCTLVARTRNLFNLIWLSPKTFSFLKKEVILDYDKKTIRIPYNYYWEKHPDGTFMLITPNSESTFKFNMDIVNKDLKQSAIDGYASQMASYSSVRPTWGHERDVIEQEGKAKFGFLDRLKGKSKPKEESEE